jgi:hypothetical protein
VRAVNLIPPEQRRGAGGIAGRSGGAAYVLIAGLVALVACGLVYAFAVHDVAKRTTTLAQVTDETNEVNVQAAALAPYVQFQSVANASISSVAQLAAQRFDWARAMKQIALALPSTVTISTLTGSLGAPSAPAVGATGVTGATGVPSDAAPATFTLSGCATTQLVIANTVARFRELSDVTSATLSTYQKPFGVKLAPSKAVAFQPCVKVSWNMTINYGPGFGIPSPKFPASASGTVER